ncbi:dephospho-CoA kinase [Idiomarina fontislapidosi]|uniref:Dephospho-CoA kinase n=1 Tax=Idiomarina fontislapidosi TaxID=263723 RepID=A0A432Y2D4_9GAMM|nr:dephospho-CoA kinase [Idiomarina fontislapidosi]PYE33270.1 dephospho-CoA kinase [Idiomarina fontislapidosi]RUO55107.1 dephospho-CoA kinase [Idiomarina fontislapidosi]
MSRFILGLTGGIGSGKSAASNYIAEQGIAIVDADVIARDVVAPGTEGLAEIIAHFGDEVVDASGALIRSKLRQRVFENPDDKAWINQLLHPLIREQIIAQLEQAQSAYVVLVAPLLLENGLDALCDRVLVIDVDEDTQLARTQQRDSVSKQQVEAIIAAQIDRPTRLKKADDVVSNQGDLRDLYQQLDRLHAHYLELAAQK